MSIIATLSTTPTRDENASEDIARAINALDNYDVDYEITAMGTIIETDDIGRLFAAVQAAHQAVEADRVTTKLEINHERDRDRGAAERVTAVEDALSDGSGAGTSTETTNTDEEDEVEEQDTVDMSGHTPEEAGEDPNEDETGMKGGDYKVEESDEAEERSLSEKYNESDGDS